MAGIYVHIPFCKQACNYCNFHFSTSLKLKDEMIAALIKEISLTTIGTEESDLLVTNKKEPIETLYFGGGTPSIIDIKDLELLLAALHEKFIFSEKIEITLEANPDDITPAKLELWKKIGINRLSVGIQSFIEEELVWMNRAHTATESLQCIEDIKNAGFTNFSVDLIYGSPLLTNDKWKKNTDTIFEKNIPHISCYALTVEPKTALNKMINQHKKEPVDAGKQAEQFILLMDWMELAGYDHYEISNFAKPGMKSKHNSSYWQGKRYYGFGPSAHAFDGKSRQWNIANNALYIQSLKNNVIPFEKENLTAIQQLNEYIMTSLRTIEGLSLGVVEERFGNKITRQLQSASEKWKLGGKVFADDKRIILTKEGKLFADGIAADLFF
ncbi:radical SAM family heme chaperone HemW [Ferruginibacter paludis]|uniref:radical SAM family heme chaperone HemW n=1 Tax=Ferruginibacter paludis TaxID=1310417 RepID=UPI0025B4716C|nr:radical SAM family heme chaperone HemW [Ferruginibacter paludis]MDN3658581.1 radical SAM family heme chaperone HemW [Ferruginibacter paludis]